MRKSERCWDVCTARHDSLLPLADLSTVVFKLCCTFASVVTQVDSSAGSMDPHLMQRLWDVCSNIIQ